MLNKCEIKSNSLDKSRSFDQCILTNLPFPHKLHFSVNGNLEKHHISPLNIQLFHIPPLIFIFNSFIFLRFNQYSNYSYLSAKVHIQLIHIYPLKFIFNSVIFLRLKKIIKKYKEIEFLPQTQYNLISLQPGGVNNL